VRRASLPTHQGAASLGLVLTTTTQRHDVLKIEAIPPGVDELARGIVECAFKVHRQIGAGLLESVYETCLCYELRKAGFRFVSQATVPMLYDTLRLDTGLRLDLLIEDQVIVELKAVEELLPVHQAQLLTYLKLAGKRLGLLINFNTPLLKDGIRRFAL
jgi:GxxExxY protein